MLRRAPSTSSVQAGAARPSADVPGATELELPFGSRARVLLAESDLSFDIAVVRASRRVAVGALSTFEPAAHAYTGMSAFLHLAVVGSLAFFMPGMNADAAESGEISAAIAMKPYLDTIAEREHEHEEEAVKALDAAADRQGGSGQRAGGEEGALGTPLTQNKQARYGAAGTQDNPDPHLAKLRALDEIRRGGMIGILASDLGGDPRAPIAAWGRDDMLGRDPKSALGNMWGPSIDDALGAGALGLSGAGEGGGCEQGSCEGIGLDHIGDLGHGAAGRLGQGIGPGDGGAFGHGLPRGGYRPKALHMPREGKIDVGGQLPAEVVQRIVRQNFGRFRLCYESGLRGNPALQGRVAVKFVIDRSGNVSLSSDAGSDLPDQGVVQCVVRGFNNLSFPEPQGGVVRVVYPIVFTPGE